jgi:hypothetical protein
LCARAQPAPRRPIRASARTCFSAYCYNARVLQSRGGDREQVQRHRLRFSRVPGSFAVCRLSAKDVVPEWALHGPFFSVTRTSDELSIVCSDVQVPADIHHENDWACLKLEGPFPFSETGILTSFVQPLSDRAIPIFAMSTFDTDYVLVKSAWLEKAIAALQDAGHEAV